MRWIPASERMPEEHDSIYEELAKKNKLPKGLPIRYSKSSDDVIVTVQYEDKSSGVMIAKTKDGAWDTQCRWAKKKVIAWMPMPEPYREEKQDGDNEE